MAGAWTTINILDATGTSKTMRVWSENSTTGPYSFGQALDDGSGAGVIPAIKAGASLPSASTDPALVVTIRDINANGQTTMSASAPVVIASDQSVITVRYPILVSAGTSQFALAVTTNTTLTVPGGTRLAQFSVETADVRYTDDGTSATTTVGQLAKAGSAWQYAGPLASMKFTAVSGSPTINVSYYK